ncbi:unnamed protein product [Euphydryas editha]|uniref:Uncharacterized protein n=1 Tax=Euphydryas editha TaxID=104508 RepID=A0AAU9U682_EUPED|nr:unnamed protein product [Euphydryas editha]
MMISNGNMSEGHHIGERAHVIEREQNVYSGDAEERQEFINLDEEEAEDFDREFQQRAGAMRSRARAALPPAPSPRLALPPAPSAHAHSPSAGERRHRPHARRPLRAAASPRALPSSGVREVYGGSHPQRHRHKHHRHRHSPVDN